MRDPSCGGSGIVGTIRRIMHDDISQLTILMNFLHRHIREAKIRGSAAPVSAGEASEASGAVL